MARYPQGDFKRGVTHQVNITALTGIFPVQGEFLILRREPGVLQVAARFAGN